jgi:uncharacterized membrane protein
MADESTATRRPQPRPRSRPRSGLRSRRAELLGTAGLIALGLVPAIAGGVRLTELTGGQVTGDNARFFAAPLPVVLHVLSVVPFTMLGAVQFVARLRARRPGWHRSAGRFLVVCGLVAGLSGIWMALFYARPAGVGDLLEGFRVLFGTAMVVSVVLGYAAIRRGRVARHRAWLMRGYAIGMGAGTQGVLIGVYLAAAGRPGETAPALLHATAWVVNLGVAEWLIHRPRGSRARDGRDGRGRPAVGGQVPTRRVS